MKTNIKNYVDKFMQAASSVLEELMGKERARKVIAAHQGRIYPKDITGEDISAFLNFLYSKFPDKKKQIDSFRMNVNRANETRAAGYFFTEDNCYTVEGIIENLKEYLTNFKDWKDKVGTHVQEVRHGKAHRFFFSAFIEGGGGRGVYYDLDINEKFFFKNNKKSILLALACDVDKNLVGYVKEEAREKFRKALLDMLPEGFFVIDDLTIKSLGKDETKEASVTPKTLWSIMVREIEKHLKEYGEGLNHPACKNPDMIGENFDNMKDFIKEVNNATRHSCDKRLTKLLILEILKLGYKEYEKRSWHLFVEDDCFAIVNDKKPSELLFNGVKLIINCLKHDLSCVKLKYYPNQSGIEFSTHPSTDSHRKDLQKFVYHPFAPHGFLDSAQVLVNRFYPLIDESKKDYFLKNWTRLFPNTEINGFVDIFNA